MLAFWKELLILAIGAMMVYLLACLMLDSSEKNRIEEELFKKELSYNRKYEEIERKS